MPRVIKSKNKAKKKSVEKGFSLQLNIILLILLFQTSFLIYKNRDYLQLSKDKAVKSFHKQIMIPEILKSDSDNTISISDSMPIITDQILDTIPAIKEHTGPVKIKILNGCGVTGLASRWKYRLIKQKYDIRETGNTNERTTHSVIISKIKDMKPAYLLSKKLGIKPENVYQISNSDLIDIDLTFILGMDYRKLKIDKNN